MHLLIDEMLLNYVSVNLNNTKNLKTKFDTYEVIVK